VVQDSLNYFEQHRTFHLSFHPSGQLLASASEDSTLAIWDVTTGTMRQVSEPLQHTYILGVVDMHAACSLLPAPGPPVNVFALSGCRIPISLCMVVQRIPQESEVLRVAWSAPLDSTDRALLASANSTGKVAQLAREAPHPVACA
jgi:hypothetical protein